MSNCASGTLVMQCVYVCLVRQVADRLARVALPGLSRVTVCVNEEKCDPDDDEDPSQLLRVAIPMLAPFQSPNTELTLEHFILNTEQDEGLPAVLHECAEAGWTKLSLIEVKADTHTHTHTDFPNTHTHRCMATST